MAREERGGCRRYFYTSTWVDGRCIRTYYGGGVIGEIAAAMVDEARRRRTETAAKEQGQPGADAPPGDEGPTRERGPAPDVAIARPAGPGEADSGHRRAP